ncbi:hypothetical protein PIIN_10876 [Serendipita indica DSM 11827]|uniref:Uncharacterized protein n=1 Tax=Serendipita indica (strain DSM 11827) TaxID=1109443 RepID=G4TZZ7_SERID|nr:hypothetical protein PIIN_10876 [Serendipita indica DSM 11827]
MDVSEETEVIPTIAQIASVTPMLSHEAAWVPHSEHPVYSRKYPETTCPYLIPSQFRTTQPSPSTTVAHKALGTDSTQPDCRLPVPTLQKYPADSRNHVVLIRKSRFCEVAIGVGEELSVADFNSSADRLFTCLGSAGLQPTAI